MKHPFPDLKSQEQINQESKTSVVWDLFAVWTAALLFSVAFWIGVYHLVKWVIS